MMGMVLVACFAARLVTKFPLTRASTLGCTSLPTGLAPSPSSPRGRETQPEYFAFNITKLPWPCRNASIRVPGVLGSPQPVANPTLGTFFVCCASAGSIPATTKPISTRTVFMRQFLPLFEMLCPESLGQNVRYSIRSGVILSRSFSGVSPAELRSLAQDVGRYEPHPVHGCVAALLHVGGPFVGPA